MVGVTKGTESPRTLPAHYYAFPASPYGSATAHTPAAQQEFDSAHGRIARTL